jgi:hypothetical protein
VIRGSGLVRARLLRMPGCNPAPSRIGLNQNPFLFLFVVSKNLKFGYFSKYLKLHFAQTLYLIASEKHEDFKYRHAMHH